MVDWTSLDLWKDITGYLSVIFLACLYIPQTYYIYKTKNSDGISPTFLVLGYLLTFDTMIYGALLEEYPLIIANVLVFICMSIMTYFRFKFKAQKEIEGQKDDLEIKDQIDDLETEGQKEDLDIEGQKEDLN